MTSSPWWAPHVYADRRPFLAGRNRISAAFRAWFASQDFAEVEAAILQVSPGNEAHLHAFATELIAPDTSRAPLYLHTSPEFAAKKLLAAGEPRLFTFARVFRNRERTALHHPEFTMLEWYRANEPYEALMKDCTTVLAVAAQTAGARSFSFRGRCMDPFADPERLSVAEADDRVPGSPIPATDFLAFPSLFFFSCFARSSAFVSLVNAMFLPSGAQTGLPAPLGSSVKTKESPPAIGSIASCGGSGLPSFSVERRNSKNFPSRDQRGVVS